MSIFGLDLGGLNCGVAGLPCHHVFDLGITSATYFIGGCGFACELIQFDRHRGISWRPRAAAELLVAWALAMALGALNVNIARRSLRTR